MVTEAFDIHEICNLSSEEIEARRELTQTQLFPHVQKREERPTGLILHFEETPELRDRLDEFVAFERVCCSSIDWSVRADSGSLRLEIEGIDPKAEIFSSAGTAVDSRSDVVSPRLWPRLLRSVGLGSTAAVLLCCVLPLGVAAFVGTTSLLFLDNLWVIGGSAVVLGVLLWRWEARRAADRAAGQAATGCGC